MSEHLATIMCKMMNSYCDMCQMVYESRFRMCPMANSGWVCTTKKTDKPVYLHAKMTSDRHVYIYLASIMHTHDVAMRCEDCIASLSKRKKKKKHKSRIRDWIM